MAYSGYGGGGEYGGGGGFMNYGGGSQMSGSQAGSGSGAKGKRGDGTIRPVTIKQVLDSQPNHQFDGNTTKIDDVEIMHITLVARVLNVTEQQTNINYVVDDGTGKCDVKEWKDSDGSGEKNVQSLIGQYVRVNGQLKTYNNKRHIGAHVIRPIKDYNEVQYHLLDAVFTHLYFTRGPPMGAAGGAAGGAQSYGAGATSYGGQPGGGDVSMGGMGGGSSALPMGTTANARAVYEAIRSLGPNHNEGMHMNIIASRTNMGMDAVSRAVEELLASGIAFTTLDDNHVAVMDF